MLFALKVGVLTCFASAVLRGEGGGGGGSRRGVASNWHQQRRMPCGHSEAEAISQVDGILRQLTVGWTGASRGPAVLLTYKVWVQQRNVGVGRGRGWGIEVTGGCGGEVKGLDTS